MSLHRYAVVSHYRGECDVQIRFIERGDKEDGLRVEGFGLHNNLLKEVYDCLLKYIGYVVLVFFIYGGKAFEVKRAY